VNVVPLTELIVPSTPFPAVCISLSRNERNCFIPLATSRLAAFSIARSLPVVAYSTSFVISIASGRNSATPARRQGVPEPRPRSPPSGVYDPAFPPGLTCNGRRKFREEIFSTSPRCWIIGQEECRRAAHTAKGTLSAHLLELQRDDIRVCSVLALLFLLRCAAPASEGQAGVLREGAKTSL